MGAEEDQEPVAPGKIKITIRFPGGGNEGPSPPLGSAKGGADLGRGTDMSIQCKPTTPFSKVYAAVATQRGVAADSFKL